MNRFLPLLRPNYHGSYVDDILFGVVFLIMLAVFGYFYFSDSGGEEDGPQAEE